MTDREKLIAKELFAKLVDAGFCPKLRLSGDTLRLEVCVKTWDVSDHLTLAEMAELSDASRNATGFARHRRDALITGLADDLFRVFLGETQEEPASPVKSKSMVQPRSTADSDADGQQQADLRPAERISRTGFIEDLSFLDRDFFWVDYSEGKA